MRSHLGLYLLLLAGTAACSDNTGLPDPTITNVERSETIYALVGTPVSTPSAYAIEGNRQVRTDLSTDFDFAYNLEPDGSHVFLPRATLGIDSAATVNPGLLARSETFEGITTAPSNGYITDQPVPIAVGDRYVVRGRVTCVSLGLPKYAKLEITGFDDVARTVSFRVLTDDNCGFKGLQPGLPDH
jgi:hypothetical protein